VSHQLEQLQSQVNTIEDKIRNLSHVVDATSSMASTLADSDAKHNSASSAGARASAAQQLPESNAESEQVLDFVKALNTSVLDVQAQLRQLGQAQLQLAAENQQLKDAQNQHYIEVQQQLIQAQQKLSQEQTVQDTISEDRVREIIRQEMAASLQGLSEENKHTVQQTSETIGSLKSTIRDLQRNVTSIENKPMPQGPILSEREIVSKIETVATRLWYERNDNDQKSPTARASMTQSIADTTQNEVDRNTVRTMVQSEMNVLIAKCDAIEGKLVALLESRLGGYTDIHSAMEKRFEAVVKHHTGSIDERYQHLESQLQSYQKSAASKVNELDQQLRHVAGIVVSAPSETSQQDTKQNQAAMAATTVALATSAAKLEQLMQRADDLERGHKVRDKLVSEMELDIRTNQQSVQTILEVCNALKRSTDEAGARAWSAEKICSRLAEDVITRVQVQRQNLFRQLHNSEAEWKNQFKALSNSVAGNHNTTAVELERNIAATNAVRDTVQDLHARISTLSSSRNDPDPSNGSSSSNNNNSDEMNDVSDPNQAPSSQETWLWKDVENRLRTLEQYSRSEAEVQKKMLLEEVRTQVHRLHDEFDSRLNRISAQENKNQKAYHRNVLQPQSRQQPTGTVNRASFMGSRNLAAVVAHSEALEQGRHSRKHPRTIQS
jgi:chromosome segregation ATPase